MDDSDITVRVPRYSRDGGLRDVWIDGKRLRISIEAGEGVLIAGDSAGLYWLAATLLALSQKEVPSGYHQHYSAEYMLEPPSVDLIVSKLEEEEAEM